MNALVVTPNPAFRYRPEVDGLRAVAVFAVVWFHANLGCPGGYVGVDVFFVISGFLITSLLLRDIDAANFRLLGFWERRIRRIVPALVATVLFTLIGAWFIFLPQDFIEVGQATMALTLCGSNIYHWLVTGYFGPDADTLPLLHTWSLAVEEQFYIFLPLTLSAIAVFRPTWLRTSIVLGCLLSLGFGIWATPRFTSSSFFLLPARAWELLLGSVLAAFPMWGQSVPRWMKELCCLAGLAAIGYAIMYFNADTLFPGTAALFPCLGTLAIIWANFSQLTLAGRVLAWAPFVFVGQVSYSFYLLHWPLFVFARYWRRDEVSNTQMAALAFIAFLLAVVSWRVIEIPFRKSVWLPKRRNLFFAATLAFVLLLAGGELISVQNGFPSRFKALTLAYHASNKDHESMAGLLVVDALAGRIPEIGDTQGSQKCLVWGDSHAISLSPSLDNVFRKNGIHGYRAAYRSTVPLLNYESRGYHSHKKRSVEFNSAIFDFAIKQRVATVIIIAAWMNYDIDPEFELGLIATVRKLTEAGINVAIVRTVPKQKEAIPWLLARASLNGGTHEIGVPLKQHQELNRPVDTLFERIAGPHVTILDPTPFFLDEKGLCRAELDGDCLYVDSNHVTLKGAKRLEPMFEEYLLQTQKRRSPGWNETH